MTVTQNRTLIIAITGATGAIYGIRLLEALSKLDVRTELILSKWAETTVKLETGLTPDEVRDRATRNHSPDNLAAALSSGSYRTDGMAVVPCSMKTLSAIAMGYGDSLIHRAADVTLKEKKKLLLAPRETPLNTIHLENMLKLSRMGVDIVPPMPAFYNNPTSLDDLVAHFVQRVLDQFGFETDIAKRWGKPKRRTSE